MGNFFPRWTNWVPLKIAVCLGFIVVGITVGANYYLTPKYARVGYEPTQPVPFSHRQHVGELGLDCRYCHSYVEVSGHANVPTNQTCYNCHGPDKLQVKKDSEKLAAVRHANETGDPINWIKVHKAPDYVYFNHSVHVNRGVSCVSCHGRIDKMEVVRHEEPHSMGWCLDCHRDPKRALRPLDEVTNLGWNAESGTREDFYAKHVKMKDEDAVRALLELDKDESIPADKSGKAIDVAKEEFGPDLSQKEVGALLKAQWKVHAPEDCTACHR